MHCKAKTTAIARLWRGFATLQGAQIKVLCATRDLFSVALTRQRAPYAEEIDFKLFFNPRFASAPSAA
jgi:hypothetical protein